MGGKAGEVRHLTFLHEMPEKLRVHAVDAENDELVSFGGIRRRTLARELNEGQRQYEEDRGETRQGRTPVTDSQSQGT